MKQPSDIPKLTVQETQLIERLRQPPELLVRMQSIVELAHAADGPLKSADEGEALLIQELPLLGHLTMTQWATQAQVRVAEELQRQDATVRSRKKKNAAGVVCVGSRGRG